MAPALLPSEACPGLAPAIVFATAYLPLSGWFTFKAVEGATTSKVLLMGFCLAIRLWTECLTWRTVRAPIRDFYIGAGERPPPGPTTCVTAPSALLEDDIHFVRNDWHGTCTQRLLTWQTTLLIKHERERSSKFAPIDRSIGGEHGAFIFGIVSVLMLIREMFMMITVDTRWRQTDERFAYPLVALPELLVVLLLCAPGLLRRRSVRVSVPSRMPSSRPPGYGSDAASQVMFYPSPYPGSYLPPQSVVPFLPLRQSQVRIVHPRLVAIFSETPYF
ncbi:hypothetical protein BDZ89DRAFT_1045122 [Hymenopellis radicata]|nr:hypothetical protein BDZ89DRAFT_1045122 [Hymenopellis radicata]